MKATEIITSIAAAMFCWLCGAMLYAVIESMMLFGVDPYRVMALIVLVVLMTVLGMLVYQMTGEEE